MLLHTYRKQIQLKYNKRTNNTLIETQLKN